MIKTAAAISGALFALFTGAAGAADIPSTLLGTVWCATPNSVLAGYADNPYAGDLAGASTIGAIIRFYPQGANPSNPHAASFMMQNVVRKKNGTISHERAVHPLNSWSIHEASNVGALASVYFSDAGGMAQYWYIVNNAQGQLQIQNRAPVAPQCASGRCWPPQQPADQFFVPCNQ